MNDKHALLLSEVADYYAAKLAEHGETARGVDWNGEASQTLRFEQLSKIIDSALPFSVNDLGCGYGGLHEFLLQRHRTFGYCGIDVSEQMIEAARRRVGNGDSIRFVVAGEPDTVADYGMASGIFNVRQRRTDDEWKTYIEATLDAMNRTSRLGFSFNCLTSYSDAEKMRESLYYGDPCYFFDLCKRRYSRNVALLHDYGLYEFTVLVRS